MKKPTLVIMAAGMGSRYGGLKQIDPVDAEGDKIIDFSVYDAMRAGFEKVVFIIKKENENDFREAVGNSMSSKIKVEYAFQELTDIPEGCSVIDGRTKPYGTAHAVLAARNLIDGPFAVINADDYYGVNTFKVIYDYLMTPAADDGMQHYCMVGFALGNTLTENGSVSRGICETDDNDNLIGITEFTKIIKTENGAAYTDDEVNYMPISDRSVTSMNIWGFSAEFVDELKEHFDDFYRNVLPNNPMKAECYLPFVVNDLLKDKKAVVKVLRTEDKWFGVTYKEDKPYVSAQIASLKAAGVYPQFLWK